MNIFKNVIRLTVLFFFVLGAREVLANNNNMIKECLVAYNYQYDAPVEHRLNNFNWQDASNCVSNFVIEEQKKKVKAQQEFLKEKPWYKGKNWKWEDRAEYTCTKQYHTGLVICRKPYYVN
jgi:hypothetical protein